MNTNLFRKLSFVLCAMIIGAFASARGELISSTYVGSVGGNWSDPANWSPAIVPNNSATKKFDVSVGSEYPGVTLDIRVNIESLTLTQDFSAVLLDDHSLKSDATSLAAAFPNQGQRGGFLLLNAVTRNVLADLGKLADFSGTTLNTGNFEIDASAGVTSGLTATVRFNAADIRRLGGYIGLSGAGSRIIDEQGNDALAHLNHILLGGDFNPRGGRNFTTGGSLVNEGAIFVDSAGFSGADAPTTFTVNGNYTGVGYPLDPGTDGLGAVLAPGANARMIINGHLTNYDAATQTLHKSIFNWTAANDHSATTRVLSASGPLDIVTSRASLTLIGPNTGFRDKFENDALRNLSTSALLTIGDRNFTTANSFASTVRLLILGDTRFTVQGHLTIRKGFLEVSPLTGYARFGDDSFPVDPPYISSRVIVRGNFNLPSTSSLVFHIVDQAATATIKVEGAAIFAGLLQARVSDPSTINATDTFTVLIADSVVGQFSNVASGGRVNAYARFDLLGNPIDDPVGTFHVIYGGTSLVLSDFQPN
jgi:hypothetical protein